MELDDEIQMLTQDEIDAKFDTEKKKETRKSKPKVSVKENRNTALINDDSVKLLYVKQKNIDNVGFTFLFATCLKIGISFVLLMPILNSKISNIGYEKINFFIVFAIFLSIETVVAVRILNNNQ